MQAAGSWEKIVDGIEIAYLLILLKSTSFNITLSFAL